MTARAGDTPPSGAPAVIRESLQGKYAGFASRSAAFAADAGVSAGVFMPTLAAISFAARALTGKDITWNKGGIWVVIACAAWAFVHFACCRAASGRTAGMALSGVPVVRDDGTDASGRRAVVRTPDHAAAACQCRFFIRPGRAAARASRRRSRRGSGCLLA